MKENEEAYAEAVKKLDVLENYTEDEIIGIAKEMFRTISVDRKQIVDRYIKARQDLSNYVLETLLNPEYTKNASKVQQEQAKSNILIKYIAYLQEEAKLNYNNRLLERIK